MQAFTFKIISLTGHQTEITDKNE